MPHFYPPPNPPTLALIAPVAYAHEQPKFQFVAASTAVPKDRPVRSPKFRAALAHTLKWEGGYVEVDVSPAVGETNYGVTTPVARAHGYRGPMKSIPLDVVEDIYARSYWLAPFEVLPTPLAVKVFDTGVNAGTAQAVRFLQRALGVPATGRYDAATAEAAARIGEADVAALLESLRSQQRNFYLQLIDRNPKLGVYKRGWLRRAAS